MRATSQRLTGSIVAVLFLLLAAGCGGGAPKGELSGPITISSSETALPLLQAAKQEFQKKHPKVTVNLSDEGSLKGLERVAMGAADVGVSQVEASREQARELREHKIAITPYVIILHKDVPINNLPLDKAAKIFSGEITNWRELHGYEGKIVVVATPQGSGSHTTILQRVLEGEGTITNQAVILDATQQVQERVAATPGAIGYVEAPQFDPDKAKAVEVDGVPFSARNFAGGTWPVFTYEHLYTKGEPEGVVKAFLDFVLSGEFQQGAAAKLKYVPIKGTDK